MYFVLLIRINQLNFKGLYFIANRNTINGHNKTGVKNWDHNKTGVRNVGSSWRNSGLASFVQTWCLINFLVQLSTYFARLEVVSRPSTARGFTSLTSSIKATALNRFKQLEQPQASNSSKTKDLPTISTDNHTNRHTFSQTDFQTAQSTRAKQWAHGQNSNSSNSTANSVSISNFTSNNSSTRHHAASTFNSIHHLNVSSFVYFNVLAETFDNF